MTVNEAGTTLHSTRMRLICYDSKTNNFTRVRFPRKTHKSTALCFFFILRRASIMNSTCARFYQWDCASVFGFTRGNKAINKTMVFL